MLLVSNVRALAERNSLPGHGLLDVFFSFLSSDFSSNTEDYEELVSTHFFLLQFYVDMN